MQILNLTSVTIVLYVALFGLELHSISTLRTWSNLKDVIRRHVSYIATDYVAHDTEVTTSSLRTDRHDVRRI